MLMTLRLAARVLHLRFSNRYVEGVVQRGEELRASIEEYREQQRIRTEAQRREKDDKEFGVLAQVRWTRVHVCVSLFICLSQCSFGYVFSVRVPTLLYGVGLPVFTGAAVHALSPGIRVISNSLFRHSPHVVCRTPPPPTPPCHPSEHTPLGQHRFYSWCVQPERRGPVAGKCCLSRIAHSLICARMYIQPEPFP